MKLKKIMELSLSSLVRPYLSSLMMTALLASPSAMANVQEGGLPVAFEPLAEEQGFQVRLAGGDLRLDRHGNLFLHRRDGEEIRLELLGAGATHAQGLAPQGQANYFLGPDPDGWRSNVPLYSSVRFREVCSGIDLVYRGRDGRLEHDFHIRPGASVDSIRMKLSAPPGHLLRLDPEGNLHAGDLVLLKPEIFQDIDGRRVEIEGRFELFGESSFGYRVGEYDRGKMLVIDPVLLYSTFYGGPGGERAENVRLDGAGNIYVAGSRIGAGFPTTPGAFQETSPGDWDVAVLKLSPDGSQLLYATYFGGSAFESDVGLAVDTAGNAWVAARTFSDDLPLVNPIQSQRAGRADMLVAKLSPDGSSLLFATYLGGSGSDRNVWHSIETDKQGRAYVVGRTRSLDFPVVQALQSAHAGGQCFNTGGEPIVCTDIFLTVYAADGSSMLYSTYLGGTGNDTNARALVLEDGHVLLAGTTTSADFPAVATPHVGGAGARDLFVTKLAIDGSAPIFTARFGGSGVDEKIRDLAVAADGHILLSGYTTSTDFPVVRPLQEDTAGSYDGFLMELSPSGVEMIFSTYLGGSASDIPWRLDLDPIGNLVVGGYTWSVDFPSATPEVAGDADSLIARVHRTGPTLLSSRLHGGTAFDSGNDVVVPGNGETILVGNTDSENLPLVDPIQAVYGGHSHREDVAEMFIARLGDDFAALSTPARVHARSGERVTVPIELGPGGFDLVSGAWSLGWDPDCLALDPTDTDGDEIPDSIQLNVPVDWLTSITAGPTEVGFVLVDLEPPLEALPWGALAEVTFDVICELGSGSMDAAMSFGDAPAPSFGDIDAQSVEVHAIAGSVIVHDGEPGDCNADGVLDAADLTACVLELFDADGSFWLETIWSTFVGDPVGCDSNVDTRIDAADLACKIRLLQGGVCSGDRLGARLAEGASATLSLPHLTELLPGDLVDIPLTLDLAGGVEVTSLVVSIDFPERALNIDETDLDGDGLPDRLTLSVADGLEALVDWNGDRRFGELQLVVYSPVPGLLLQSGQLVSLQAEVSPAVPVSVSSIGFGQAPLPSVGLRDGNLLAPDLVTGSLIVLNEIFADGFETGDLSAWDATP